MLFQVVDDILDGDGYRRRARRRRRPPARGRAAARARAALGRVDADTSVLAEIVDGLAVRTVVTTAVAKKRLDVLLVERGLAESRAQAQALVLAGLVPGHSKPGEQVDEDAPLEVELAAAVRLARRAQARERARRVRGRRRPASTASTSARRPAASPTSSSSAARARVIALDVGYGQLHPRLRDDPRVTVLERTNARALTELPFAPQLVTCDVSFIRVRLALPPALALAAPGWQALVLVKPQFEAGRAERAKRRRPRRRRAPARRARGRGGGARLGCARRPAS